MSNLTGTLSVCGGYKIARLRAGVENGLESISSFKSLFVLVLELPNFGPRPESDTSGRHPRVRRPKDDSSFQYSENVHHAKIRVRAPDRHAGPAVVIFKAPRAV